MISFLGMFGDMVMGFLVHLSLPKECKSHGREEGSLDGSFKATGVGPSRWQSYSR